MPRALLAAALLLVVGIIVVVGGGAALDDPDRNNNNELRQQQQPDCDSASYQKSALTLLSSKKFAAMYLRSGHMRQFEGSGISIGPTGKVAVVFDNSHALGMLDSPLAESGELLGERGGSQSGWEGVAWRDDAASASASASASAAAGGAGKGGGENGENGETENAGAATILALREAVEVPPPPSLSGGHFSWAPLGFPSGNRNSSSSSNSSSNGSSSSSSSTVDRKKKKKKKKHKRRSDADDDGDAAAALFAVIDELSVPTIAGDPPRLLRSCPVDFALTHGNKGLEDLYYLGGGRALALCEGNFCVGGSEGREKGNGRILVLRLEEESGSDGEKNDGIFVGGERAAAAAATARARRASGGASGGGGGPRKVVVPSSSSSSSLSLLPPPLFAAPCAWRVDAVLDLPSDALFEDYSGLAVRGGLAAVLSQRDEAAFVAGFDVASLKFDPVPEDRRFARRVFALPRSQTCERTFCTAEGIDLVDDPLVRGVVRVVVATDKAAAGSPWNCIRTAEAVHVMSLPKHALPQAPEEGEREEEEEEEEEEGEGEQGEKRAFDSFFDS